MFRWKTIQLDDSVGLFEPCDLQAAVLFMDFVVPDVGILNVTRNRRNKICTVCLCSFHYYHELSAVSFSGLHGRWTLMTNIKTCM